jgi:hypothetical protein
MIMVYAIYGVVLFVTAFMPTLLQIVLLAINIFVPDPVPFIDEVIQAGFIIRSISKS